MHLILFTLWVRPIHPTYSTPPDLYVSVFKGPASKVSEGEESSSSYLFPTCKTYKINYTVGGLPEKLMLTDWPPKEMPKGEVTGEEGRDGR